MRYADRLKRSTPKLAAALGVSSRQVDHWVTSGWLHPEPRARENSGSPRTFARGEVKVAAVAAALLEAGVEHAAAFASARHIVRSGGSAVRLARNVHLVVEDAVLDQARDLAERMGV